MTNFWANRYEKDVNLCFLKMYLRGTKMYLKCCRGGSMNNASISANTHKHGSHIVRELLGYDREGGCQERSIPHGFYNSDDEAQRDEGNMAFHFIQHSVEEKQGSVIKIIILSNLFGCRVQSNWPFCYKTISDVFNYFFFPKNIAVIFYFLI